MAGGREPVQHRARPRVVVVLLLHPAGRRRRVGAAPPRRHVGYVGRHFLFHSCNNNRETDSNDTHTDKHTDVLITILGNRSRVILNREIKCRVLKIKILI